MPDPTDRWGCNGVDCALCCVLITPELRNCCVDSGTVRDASKFESYGPFSSGVCPLGEASYADVPSLAALSLLEPTAAAAAARSFFDAFPRFLRSRAYSQLSPNSKSC